MSLGVLSLSTQGLMNLESIPSFPCQKVRKQGALPELCFLSDLLSSASLAVVVAAAAAPAR